MKLSDKLIVAGVVLIPGAISVGCAVFALEWEALVAEAARTGVLRLPDGQTLTGIPLSSYIRVAYDELRAGVEQSGRPYWPGEPRPPRPHSAEATNAES